MAAKRLADLGLAIAGGPSPGGGSLAVTGGTWPSSAAAAVKACDYDLVIRGGRVYCSPGHAPGTVLDVAVLGGKIVAVEPPGVIPPGCAKEDVDAAGLMLTPGLVDIHAHIFPGVMQGSVAPDEWCLARCTTTAVDAGSTGANTLDGFVKYVAAVSATRCLSFVNIGNHGLASMAYGHLDQVQVEPTVKAIEKHRDYVVGVKLLLTASYANDGQSEYTAYQRALEATARVGLPLMTHHSSSVIPLDHAHPRVEQQEAEGSDLGCPSSLRPGDIYTHCFHGFKSTIIDGGACIQSIGTGNGFQDVVPAPPPPPGAWHVSKACVAAKARGVLFDVGHGQGSFSWTVAELAAMEEFWPDCISTDIHYGSNRGPCYDMQTAMTKMLMVGMPIADVVAAGTSQAAAAIGWGDRIGSIAVGMEADLALLELKETDCQLEDSQGQLRRCTRRLVGRAVWRAGARFAVSQPEDADAYGFPSARSQALARPNWEILAVRDPTPPPPVAPEFATMIQAHLDAIADHVATQEALMPARGDGNPNTPLLLCLPECIETAPVDKDDAAEEAVFDALHPGLSGFGHANTRVGRVLISYPERERWLEDLRREALRTRCC
jgi:dihydroorotase